MRRRQRYERLVWLQRLDGDPADGRLVNPDGQWSGIATAVSILNERHHLIVEVEQQKGVYTVRCIPQREPENGGSLRVAASYTGSNLGGILNAAVRDFTALEDNPRTAIISPREVVRFVVP